MELLEIPPVTLSACVVGHGLDIGHTPSVESLPKKSLLAIPRSAEESVSASPDGLNDTAQIDFDLLLVTDSVGIAFDICALSGQRVRRIVPSVQRAGPVRVEWDGRDERGLLLPPGLYLYQLRVDGDTSTQAQAGLLGIAY